MAYFFLKLHHLLGNYIGLDELLDMIQKAEDEENEEALEAAKEFLAIFEFTVLWHGFNKRFDELDLNDDEEVGFAESLLSAFNPLVFFFIDENGDWKMDLTEWYAAIEKIAGDDPEFLAKKYV